MKLSEWAKRAGMTPAHELIPANLESVAYSPVGGAWGRVPGASIMKKSSPASILALVAAVAMTLPAHAGDIVVVMGSGAAALTKDQVANVYLGRDNHLKPVDLPEANTVREAFYKKATDRDATQIKALWSRITFTGEGLPPKELPNAAAVKKAVTADPKAIGYIEKADVDASVKVILELN